MSADTLVPPRVSADALNRGGAALFQMGRYGEAEDVFQQAVAVDPSHDEAWSNLGFTYQTCGYRDRAMECYMTSIRLNPENPFTLTNIGFLTQDDGHRDAAKSLFRKAMALRPEGYPQPRANLAIAELMDHNFEAGWPLWEAHYEMEPSPPIASRLPRWDGSAGHRVALWKEQGLGDEILFATLLPELIGRGLDFVVEMDERLLPAFRRSFPTHRDAFVARRPFVAVAGLSEPQRFSDEAFAECDVQAPMGALAGLYRRSKDAFAGQPHRLLVPAVPKVRKDGQEMTICVAWRTFLPTKGTYVERRKSSALHFFAPLARLRGVRLSSVQYGEVGTELLDCGFEIARPAFDPFWNIEALLNEIEASDAVVTTCNVTAHLAGALGKRCYVMYLEGVPPLFSWAPDERGRSLWYPSCRVVADPAIRTWPQAIEVVTKELQTTQR